MEALSSLIAKAIQRGFIRGFKIEGRGKLRIKFHTFCLPMIPFSFVRMMKSSRIFGNILSCVLNWCQT